MSRLRRLTRFPALLTAVVVLLVIGPALTSMRGTPRLSLPAPVAIHDALRAKFFKDVHYTSVTVAPVDNALVRVSFYAGARIAAQVAVRPNGSIRQALAFTKLNVPYGDWIAYQPAVLLGLALLFVMMAAVTPLRRLRNVDVAAALSLIAPLVLLQQRYLDLSVVAAVPGLVYLMVRCAVAALGPRRDPGPSTPLFDHLTRGLGAHERVRVLRLLLVALALVVAMVGISSADAVDVIYAVMEGATRVIHGVLPYGHLPGDVIHGDTYPILSYALYAPLALLAPVNSIWDSVDGALAVSVAAALLCAGGAYVVSVGGLRRRPDPHAEAAGLRSALAFLSFPLVMITVSTGTTDVMLGLMLSVAIALWRRPVAGAGWLAVAGWFKLAPFALLPVWLAPLRGRRLVLAVAAVSGVSVAMVALLVGLAGAGGPSAMLHAISYQFMRGSPQSLWAGLGIDGLQPLGQAAVLALIAGATVRFRRDPSLAADPVRVAAISASIMIGLQLSADYWTFLYVIWALPLLNVSLFTERATAVITDTVQVPAALPVALPLWGR
jgi:hypothetical protein